MPCFYLVFLQGQAIGVDSYWTMFWSLSYLVQDCGKARIVPCHPRFNAKSHSPYPYSLSLSSPRLSMFLLLNHWLQGNNGSISICSVDHILSSSLRPIYVRVTQNTEDKEGYGQNHTVSLWQSAVRKDCVSWQANPKWQKSPFEIQIVRRNIPVCQRRAKNCLNADMFILLFSWICLYF